MAVNRKERRARQHLFKHLPEALGYAHAMNDALALDMHTMMTAARDAGLPTFPELCDQMVRFRATIITAKDNAERQALRDRIGTFNRAVGLYGYSGSALPTLLAPISNEMPPQHWHLRVLLNDNGQVLDAAEAEWHVATPGVSCKSEPPRGLH